MAGSATLSIPASRPPRIASVAVIGAGEQGRRFALRCARAGFATVLEDVLPSRLRQAQKQLEELSNSPEAVPLSFAPTVEDAVRQADLAVDFVPDELESKLEIFSLLDRMAPPRTILCTPTRALSISDLASCTYRAGRCLALQADGADLLTEALRLVPGRATEPAITEAVRTWLTVLGITVEVLPEVLP